MADNVNQTLETVSGPIVAQSAAIRYFSRGGNVKAMAEALSRGADVEAISITKPGARITEPVDLLFIGGALYKWQLDPKLPAYIRTLDPDLIGTAIVFGSSALFRRPVLLIQDVLKEVGIPVNTQALYARNHPNQDLEDAFEYFARNEMTRDRSLDGLAPWQIVKRSREQREAREAAEAAAAEAGDEE